LLRSGNALFVATIMTVAAFLAGTHDAGAAVRGPAALRATARPGTPVTIRAQGRLRPYGPAPAPGVVPGGFTTVVTSVTIGPTGGTIGPVTVDGAAVTLAIPAGAFPASVQITVTAPDLAAIGGAVAGVGVQVTENGAPFPGTFATPVTLTVHSASITAGSTVVVWNGTAFVTDTSSTVAAGTATVSFDHDPDFAVLAGSRAISGATTPVTGEPFLGEGILAGVLVLAGATGLALGNRRRARAGS